MSTRKYFAILTDVGQSKIAEAVAGGQKLNITTFLAGDGNGEYYIPTSDMTTIKNEVWRGSISKTEIVQDAQKILRVTTVIPAEVSGFIVREIGLLDETGELVAIGNSPDLPKVRLEDGASTELKLTMRLAVKNTEVFSFTIDPHTVIMTKDMLDTHNVDSNAHEELFEGKADKQHQHSTDDIISGTLPIERGGTGNTTGLATSATKLATARTIRTNLGSTSTASFDGTTNVTLGVTGTLPIANGGTGNTTGLAASATKLATARTIDGMPFDGSANVVHFGICNTAAATAEKTVSLTGFVLTEGARIAVRFTNANTASSPMLNVNNTGAKYLNYTQGQYAPSTQWIAGDIIEFVYYNGQWIMLTANARKLATARTIDGMPFDGSANIMHFGVCETAADVQRKEVSIPGFVVAEGARVIVYFKNNNTANIPTLVINGRSHLIISHGYADGSGTFVAFERWNAHCAVEFVFCESYWFALTMAVCNLATGVTGTLPIANGGTGATSASTALSNLGGFAKTGGTISGATTIQGNLTLKTASSNYGCKINFGDGDYVHLYEITDDKLEIKANNIDFVVSGNITKNGAAFGGSGIKERESIAIGTSALPTNTGEYNIAIGYQALKSQNSYNDNVAIGRNSLGSSTSGYYNVGIGSNSLSNLTTYNSCVGLGNNAQVTGSSQVQLGNTSVTVYAQKALVVRSDARDKLDIEDSPLGLNFIMKLRPRKYRMNSREAYFEQDKERDFTATNDGSKAGKRPHYGLVAQEVKEAMNELGVDFAGYLDSKVDGGEDVLSLGYAEFIAPMVKAIQQQQQIIEQLQKEVEMLKG